MAPKQILIVEDVEEMLLLLERFIGSMAGFAVSGLARNGAQLRRELSRRKPDLVLLDEILPGESSMDLLAELRGSGIPVIVLTSVQSPEHPVPAGAFGRLTKPGWRSSAQDLDRFRAMIHSALAALGEARP